MKNTKITTIELWRFILTVDIALEHLVIKELVHFEEEKMVKEIYAKSKSKEIIVLSKYCLLYTSLSL